MFIGQLGRYEELAPIDRRSTGIISRVSDLQTGQVVAIKLLDEVYNADPDFVARFPREMHAISALQHPSIVQVYDYGQHQGTCFVVEELVDGTDLRRYVRSRGVLAVDRAVRIAHDVALALGAAHQRGIVHRMVNPQTVLVRRDGSITLTDFGLYSSRNLGGGLYCAPEQATSDALTPATDVYALGCVLYEMLTGRPPFQGETSDAVALHHRQDAPVPPSRLNPGIPPVLEAVNLRSLEKGPEERFPDGLAFAHALERLGNDLPGA